MMQVDFICGSAYEPTHALDPVRATRSRAHVREYP